MKKETEKELLKLVKKNYQDIADQFSETRKKELWPGLKKIAKTVEEKSRVLDLGCGNGRLLTALQDKQINYLGIDQSEKLIELAQKRFPQKNFAVYDINNIKNFSFKKADSPSSFDYIFMVAVLQHIPSKKRRIDLLKSLKKYLSPKGQIVVTNWNIWETDKKNLVFKTYLLRLLGKNDLNFGDILFDWKSSSGLTVSKRYYHAFTMWGLKRLFKKSGYKITNAYKEGYNYYIIAK